MLPRTGASVVTAYPIPKLNDLPQTYGRLLPEVAPIGSTKPEVEMEQKEAAEVETPLFVPACLKASDVRFLIQQGIEIPGLERY